jgi:hypothetical protein
MNPPQESRATVPAARRADAANPSHPVSLHLGNAAARLRFAWSRYGNRVLLLVAAWLAVTGYLRLRYAFYLLVVLEAGYDLKARIAEAQHWFSGLRIYGVMEYAEYPPASYVMLWPLVGWTTRTAASWLWGALLAASIAALAWLCVRESGASTWQQRIFMAMLPLPLYATQMTAWFGQLSVQVTALLLTGLLLLYRRRASWAGDVVTDVERGISAGEVLRRVASCGCRTSPLHQQP